MQAGGGLSLRLLALTCLVPACAASHLPKLCLPTPFCLSLLMGAKNQPWDGSCSWLPMGDSGYVLGRAGTMSILQTQPAVAGRQRRKQPFGSF